MTAGDDWPPIADPVARIVVLFRGGTTIRALTDMFGLPDQVVEGIIRLAARLTQAEQRLTELEDQPERRALSGGCRTSITTPTRPAPGSGAGTATPSER